MIVYLASNNQHKCEEIAQLLTEYGAGIDLRSAREIGGMPSVDETEDSFVGNARLKAMALVEKLPNERCWVLADDSGLEVDALGGAPGVHSARFAGAQGDDQANNRKLLLKLSALPFHMRTARFRCVLLLRNPVGDEAVFSGTCEGRIAESESGPHGFGYDPLFIPKGFSQSFGELGPDVKSRLSHRAKAVQAWAGEWA